MADITVIGSFVMDNVVNLYDFPTEGQTVLGIDSNYYPGGKGINQGVAVARLGGNIEMIGMLGGDLNGQEFRKIMKEEKIICDNVFECEKPTAIAQIQIDSKGQNKICVIPSANYEFSFEHVDIIDSILKNTNLIVLQLELRLDVTEEIIKRANKYGTKVLLNPAPAAKLSQEIYTLIDYITPNESELQYLTGIEVVDEKSIIEASNLLLKKGVKNVIATLGKNGAVIVNSKEISFIKTFKVDVVDTVAAGDSFNGALAVKIVEGASLKQAVIYANAMGALTTTKKGAIPSLHFKEDVNNFILTQTI